jgi:hypothetical protein
MSTLSTNLSPILAKTHTCFICDYSCCKKSDLEKHFLTEKHKQKLESTNTQQLSTKTLNQLAKPYCCCLCDKIFSDRSGLWRHNKKKHQPEKTQNIILSVTDLDNENKQQQLIEFLLKENAEFKQLMVKQYEQSVEQNKVMLELAKNSAGHHNTNNTNNTNNNHFNLNFFLNETCKNAMNITDFVSQLKVEISDLEETGRLGFAEGISRIFINGLKQIELDNRPLHCTDSKREVVYIKDKNEWNKETENKPLLLKAIKQVAHKNIGQIMEWTKLYPEYNDSSSKQSDKYLKIVSEAMSGGSIEESEKNYSKILKNIAKHTIVDK